VRSDGRLYTVGALWQILLANPRPLIGHTVRVHGIVNADYHWVRTSSTWLPDWPARAMIERSEDGLTREGGEAMFWVSILGGHRTADGPWRPDHTNVAVAIMGGQRLDFTQAVLEQGETRLYVFTLFGGTQIIVPRTLDVGVDGINVLGGRRVETGTALEPTNQSRLRITAVVLLGGLQVQTPAD
jgi:predicted membrane protein